MDYLDYPIYHKNLDGFPPFEYILDEFTRSYEFIEFEDSAGKQHKVAIPYVIYKDKDAQDSKFQKHIKLYREGKPSIWELIKESAQEFAKLKAQPDNNPDRIIPTTWMNGKASSELINKVLVDFTNPVKEPKLQSNKDYLKYIESDEGLRKMLDDFSIGVDCSGFVSRAIARIMSIYQVDYDDQRVPTLAEYGKGTLRDNASHLRGEGTTKKEHFEDVQVGDVLFNTNPFFHIRIVTCITEDSSFPSADGLHLVQFDTAESSSELNKIVRKHWLFSNKSNVLSVYNEKSHTYEPVEVKAKGFQLGTPLAFDWIREHFSFSMVINI